MTTVSTNCAAAQLFHALSDETRLAIIEMLRNGERCVCDLQDELDAAQSRLSFHLRVLKEAGVVNDRRDGRWVHYSLNPNAFTELQEAVASLKPARRRLPVRQDVVCCD
jgi:ArsR family transcriptional regulator